MANYHDAFPSKYLKAADVTTPQVVTIDSVDFADVGTGKSQERKLVAHFVGVPKGLILNLINSETIAEICGTDDYDTWPGHVIELYPTKTEFQGKRVPCLRVCEPARQSRLARPTQRVSATQVSSPAGQPAQPVRNEAERVPDWVTEEAVGSEQAGRARDVDEAMPNRALGEPVL